MISMFDQLVSKKQISFAFHAFGLSNISTVNSLFQHAWPVRFRAAAPQSPCRSDEYRGGVIEDVAFHNTNRRWLE